MEFVSFALYLPVGNVNKKALAEKGVRLLGNSSERKFLSEIHVEAFFIIISAADS